MLFVENSGLNLSDLPGQDDESHSNFSHLVVFFLRFLFSISLVFRCVFSVFLSVFNVFLAVFFVVFSLFLVFLGTFLYSLKTKPVWEGGLPTSQLTMTVCQ